MKITFAQNPPLETEFWRIHEDGTLSAPALNAGETSLYVGSHGSLTPIHCLACKFMFEYSTSANGDTFVDVWQQSSNNEQQNGDVMKLKLTHAVIDGIDIDECVNQVSRQGFYVLPSFMAHDVVEKCKKELDIEVPLHGTGTTQLRRSHLAKRHHLFEQLLLDHKLNLILKLLLNNDYKCATWSSNTLFMDLGAWAPHWHVDYPYHDIIPPWHDIGYAPLSIQTLWTLDPFTKDNGATLVMPGGHKKLTHPHEDPDNELGDKNCHIECPMGSLIIAHGAWWHAQGINRTNEPRTCLLGTFTRTWIVDKPN